MYKSIILLNLFLIYTISQQNEIPKPQPTDQTRMKQQEIAMKQTACYILSQHHANSKKDQIDQIISQFSTNDDKQKYINKMFAVAVQHCVPSISMDDAQLVPIFDTQFFVQKSEFNPQQMLHYFDKFDYNTIDPYIKLTPRQQYLVKYIKKINQQMSVRRQEQQARKQSPDRSDNQFQMKFFGFNSNDVPDYLKYVYILIFVAIVIGAIAFLIVKLNQTQKKPMGKKKKSGTSASPPKASTSKASPKASPKPSDKKQ